MNNGLHAVGMKSIAREGSVVRLDSYAAIRSRTGRENLAGKENNEWD